MVYDNPLAKRPLPRQPSRQIKRSPKRRKQQECDKCINVRWTNGGTFRLGSKETEKTFAASKKNQKYDETNGQLASNAFSRLSQRFEFSSENVNKTSPNFIPYTEQAERSSHSYENSDGSIIKTNCFSSNLLPTLQTNGQARENHYLVPLPAKKRDLYFAKISDSKHFSASGENFDLIPLEFTKQSLSPSLSRSYHKEQRLKNAKRERLMEMMMEVLEEFEALDNRYYFENDNDDMISWKDSPQSHESEMPLDSFSDYYTKSVHKHTFHQPENQAYLESQEAAVNIDAKTKVITSDKNHSYQDLECENEFPPMKCSTIFSSKRLQENSICRRPELYSHHHLCTRVNKSNHYSRLELNSGANSSILNKEPVSKYVIKEKDYKLRKTLNCSEMPASAVDFFDRSNYMISDAKQKSNFSNLKIYSDSKHNLKTTRSWCATPPSESFISEHNKQQKYRNSLPVYPEDVQNIVTDKADQEALENYDINHLKAHHDCLSFKHSNFLSFQQPCPLDLSCSESEPESIKQNFHLSSQFQDMPRKASASSFGTASVSSIEFASTDPIQHSQNISNISFEPVESLKKPNTNGITKLEKADKKIFYSADKSNQLERSFRKTATNIQQKRYFDVIE